MKRLMLLSTALIFSASMSFAAVTADSLVTAYQAEGYTRIEVKTGLTQIKVEAVKGTTKVEVIYDAATGAILKEETERAKREDRGTGVEYSVEDRDFLDADEDGDDDQDEDEDGDDDHDEDGDDDHDEDGDDDHEDDRDDREDDREDRADDREDRHDDRADDREDRNDDRGRGRNDD